MGHYHKENLTQCDHMGTGKTSNMNDIPCKGTKTIGKTTYESTYKPTYSSDQL